MEKQLLATWKAQIQARLLVVVVYYSEYFVKRCLGVSEQSFSNEFNYH
jgi:hypothetical protein